ncbi:MAG: zinc ribbon domain-containing protein [Anaeroplasma sp.]|uniref:zinc ribbon domain-containing protein n=1 Tax=Anaeroplasma sp. TaxID=1872523 RepID=UPI002A917EB0|nr:zinc ribbon domain-containing protein [Anaeroplasma sp.]MDY5982241.1 zinc ribbon domain-containing protein [Anaeroplasma sp.]
MYCKNCGSILQNNANFCHVCGTKVDLEDIFDAKEEENSNPFEAEEITQEEPKEEKDTFKEEPKQTSYIYGGYYGYQVDPEEQKRQQETLLRRRSFVSSLIGTIGSSALSIHSALNYFFNIFLLNSQYNTGIIGYDVYLEDAAQVLTSTGIYLFLAMLMGSVLGIIGLVASNKSKNKKGMIFGIIAVVVAVIALAFSILCFIYRSKIVGA